MCAKIISLANERLSFDARRPNKIDENPVVSSYQWNEFCLERFGYLKKKRGSGKNITQLQEKSREITTQKGAFLFPVVKVGEIDVRPCTLEGQSLDRSQSGLRPGIEI